MPRHRPRAESDQLCPQTTFLPAGARLHIPSPLAVRCDRGPELWAVAHGWKVEPQLPGPLKLLTAPSTQAHLLFPFICPLAVNAKGDLRCLCWKMAEHARRGALNP